MSEDDKGTPSQSPQISISIHFHDFIIICYLHITYRPGSVEIPAPCRSAFFGVFLHLTWCTSTQLVRTSCKGIRFVRHVAFALIVLQMKEYERAMFARSFKLTLWRLDQKIRQFSTSARLARLSWNLGQILETAGCLRCRDPRGRRKESSWYSVQVWTQKIDENGMITSRYTFAPTAPVTVLPYYIYIYIHTHMNMHQKIVEK